jgi:C4-dicarboxylate-specific signal transduction histidine kinase
VHALNNRVSAVSVCAEMAGLADQEAFGTEVLLGEVARLQRVGALIALLPARGRPEALEVAPVLDDAIALHAHHPRRRGVTCAVQLQASMQPVRAPRWALLRLLTIVVDAAKAGAQDARRDAVTLQLSSDDEAVRVRVATPENGGVYATEMAALCGGALTRHEGELVLTLPSLTELRRRERNGR